MDTTRELLVLGPRSSGKTTLFAAMRHAAALAAGAQCAEMLVTEESPGQGAIGAASAHALRSLDEGTEIPPTVGDEELILRVRGAGADVLLRGWDPPGLALPATRQTTDGTVVLLCVRADDCQAFSLVSALPPLLRAVARGSKGIARLAIVVTQVDRLTDDPEVASCVDAPALVGQLLGARLLGEVLTLLPDTPIAAFAVSAWGYADGAPLAGLDGVPSFPTDDRAEILEAWTPLGVLELLRFVALDA